MTETIEMLGDPDKAILETINRLTAIETAQEAAENKYRADCRCLKEQIIDACKRLETLGVLPDIMWR